MSEHMFKVSTTSMHTWSYRCPRCWSIAVSMMSWSKSNQVCISIFTGLRRQESLFHTCIAVQHSKQVHLRHMMNMVHFTLMKLWSSDSFSLVISLISRCNSTFSVFWLSQGSVATLIMWSGWSWYCHIYGSFVNLRVKTALQSVDFWLSYRQK